MVWGLCRVGRGWLPGRRRIAIGSEAGYSSLMTCPLGLDRLDPERRDLPCIAIDGVSAKGNVKLCLRCACDPATIVQELVALCSEETKRAYMAKYPPE